MRIYIGHVFKYSERDTCVITEIRKVKMIDNVKNNNKIVISRSELIRSCNKLLVGFLAD